MKKLIQTRLNSPTIVGNCFPTAIACFLDLESAEDAFQVQEHYEGDDWVDKLNNWLTQRGWELGNKSDGHTLDSDEFYMVSGISPRNPDTTHICIYQRGKLWHDPHPTGAGILTEDYFYYLTNNNNNGKK